MNLPCAGSARALFGVLLMFTRCYGAHFRVSRTASPRSERADYSQVQRIYELIMNT